MYSYEFYVPSFWGHIRNIHECSLAGPCLGPPHHHHSPACHCLGVNAQALLCAKKGACTCTAGTYSSKMGSYSVRAHTSHSCAPGNWACRCSGLSPAHSHPRARGYSCKLREISGYKGSGPPALHKAHMSQDFSGNV